MGGVKTDQEKTWKEKHDTSGFNVKQETQARQGLLGRHP